MVANYSGWGPGQLDQEIRRDSWLTLPATFDHVFWTGEKELWNVVFNQVQVRKLTTLMGAWNQPLFGSEPGTGAGHSLASYNLGGNPGWGLYPPGSRTKSFP